MGSRYLQCNCLSFSCCIRGDFETDDQQEVFLPSSHSDNLDMGASQSAANDVVVGSNASSRSGQTQTYRQREADLSTASSEDIARVVMRMAERQRHAAPMSIERMRNVSAYVNELYMSSTLSGRDEVSMHVQQENNRKARVVGLLEQLKTDTFKEGGQEDDECAICMIEFETEEKIRKLPCNHVYHLKCIDDWLLRSFTCPSCMEPVDSALLSAFTPKQGVDLNQLACSPASSGSSMRAVIKNPQEHASKVETFVQSGTVNE